VEIYCQQTGKISQKYNYPSKNIKKVFLGGGGYFFDSHCITHCCSAYYDDREI